MFEIGSTLPQDHYKNRHFFQTYIVSSSQLISWTSFVWAHSKCNPFWFNSNNFIVKLYSYTPCDGSFKIIPQLPACKTISYRYIKCTASFTLPCLHHSPISHLFEIISWILSALLATHSKQIFTKLRNFYNS